MDGANKKQLKMIEKENKKQEKENLKYKKEYLKMAKQMNVDSSFKLDWFTLASTGKIRVKDTGPDGDEGWKFNVEFNEENQVLLFKVNPVNPTCSEGFRAEELDKDSPNPKKITEVKMGYLISKIVFKVEEVENGGKYLVGEKFIEVLSPSIDKCKNEDDFVLMNNSIENSIPVHRLIKNAGEILFEFDVNNLGWNLGSKLGKDYMGNTKVMPGLALNKEISISIGIEYIIADTYGWSMKTYKTSIENYKLKL